MTDRNGPKGIVSVEVDGISIDVPYVDVTNSGKPIIEFAAVMKCANVLHFRDVGIRDIKKVEEIKYDRDGNEYIATRYVCVGVCTDNKGNSRTAVGSAGADNVSKYNHGIFQTYLPEIAQKRAQSRAIIMMLGIDAYSDIEMDNDAEQGNGNSHNTNVEDEADDEPATVAQIKAIRKALSTKSDEVRAKIVKKYGEIDELTKTAAGILIDAIKRRSKPTGDGE